MDDRYGIEWCGSKWVVMEYTEYAEIVLFSGSHDDCVSFIRDLKESAESEE